MDGRNVRFPALLMILTLLAACGGGGGGSVGSTTTGTGGGSGSSGGTAPPPPSIPATSIKLVSDLGDYVGGGASYAYSQANAVISVTVEGNILKLNVQGDQSWFGFFQLPSTDGTLQVGTYTGLTEYPFNNAAVGGMAWSGQGRGCNTLTASVTVSQVRYNAGALAEITLQFVQYCEGGTAALHGDVYWNASDPTKPSGPQSIPANLWQPAAGSTPASGNYIYLESQAGDYIGIGAHYLYTQANALLSVSASSGALYATVTGDERWMGDFRAMVGIDPVQAGYYPGLLPSQFGNPTRGALGWSGQGRACGTVTGWFVVDRISFSAGALSAVDVRFEQHCEGAGPALHGKIHWVAGDPTAPPGPVSPLPSGLWSAPASALPATGNYVYLESDSGDYVGGGANYLYTPDTTSFSVIPNGGLFRIGVFGNEWWFGDFQAMDTLSRLQVGYYGGLERYALHNPAKGGLDWAGQNRGCNTVSGWFVVDSVRYSGSTLLAIDLRFEQHCEGNAPALHGQIHWDSGYTTAPPPGPTVPPPPGLWQPPSSGLPSSGNYVYLESQPGDFVGAGATYLDTDANATLTMNATGGHLNIGVASPSENWNGDFLAMNAINDLEVGYYGSLQRYPFNDPVAGGLDWYGQGRGCNTLIGWFVVDNVTYSGGALTAIDLRFEQHCEGSGPALHGKIHWGP